MIASTASTAQSAIPPMSENNGHQTVLLGEAISALNITAHGIYVDGTFGRGGHSKLILQTMDAQSRLIAFDRDADAVAVGRQISDQRFEIIHAPFSQIAQRLHAAGIQKIDGLLLDLGVSSPQIDSAARGFSFQTDGPLDMRMDTTSGEPVCGWLSHVNSDELAQVISDYGEERFAVPIADAITARCAAAQQGAAPPLARTSELAQLVADTLARCRARKEPGQHPATRTFQALRIYINNELGELKEVLAQAIDLLRPGGRLAVISFHSLEDRIVKEFIRHHSSAPQKIAPKGLSHGQHAMLSALREDDKATPDANQIVLKPIARTRPSLAEVRANPRARSATLRVAERLGGSVIDSGTAAAAGLLGKRRR